MRCARLVAACVAALAGDVAAQQQSPAQVKLIESPIAPWDPALCGVGDVNGDGHPDVAIEVGGSTSYPFVRVLSGLDGSTLFIIPVPKAASALKDIALSPLGDFDLDGVPDIAVGLDGSDTAGTDSGEVRLVSGTDGGTLLTFVGDQAGALLGRSLAGVQDVDGDGVPDVAVSRAAPQAAVELRSGATGAVLQTWTADPGDVNFGHGIEAVGDVDADGTPDVAISSQGASHALGAARVCSGRTGAQILAIPDLALEIFFPVFASAAGDLNGDGHADVIAITGYECSVQVFSGADGSTLLDFVPAPSYHSAQAATLVGDTTGDGLPDYAVAVQTDNQESQGSVSLCSGADGAELFKIFYGTGEYAAPWLYGTPMWGTPVRGVGDVDGDGTPDFATAGYSEMGVYSGALAPFKIDFAEDSWLTAHDLLASGSLQPDSPLQLRIAHFPAGAPVLLVVGLSAIKVPCNFKTLVPSVDLVLGPFITDAQGEATLDSIWPAALGPGSELWFQVWNPPVGNSWWYASNGLVAKP